MQQLLLPETFGALYLCPAGQTEREQSAAAHAMLEECLPRYADMHGLHLPDTLTYQRTELGKPSFAELPAVQFSLSHCTGMAACLLSPYVCGVDIERTRPLRHKVVSRVFSQEEQAMLQSANDPDLLFTRLWTLKESYVKAIGTGISYPMKTVWFSLTPEGIVCSKSGAAFWQTCEDDYSVSVCVLR